MPLDLVAIFEALGAAAQLLPSSYERKYRDVANETITELLDILDAMIGRKPYRLELDEMKRFADAKASLVKLISNPPEAGFALHEAMKPILTNVLEVSRSFSTGTGSKEISVVLVKQLRAHRAEHHG